VRVHALGPGASWGCSRPSFASASTPAGCILDIGVPTNTWWMGGGARRRTTPKRDWRGWGGSQLCDLRY
jgi:hypothetical protein